MEEGAKPDQEEVSIVTFEVGGERFGVDVSNVEGVIEPGEIIRMPRAPDYVVGITNLRGKVIAVIDLAKKLNLAGAGDAAKTPRKIVVVQAGDLKAGILVESPDVIRISQSVIEPSPVKMPGESGGAFVRGIAKLESGLVVILDIEEMFGRWAEGVGVEVVRQEDNKEQEA